MPAVNTARRSGSAGILLESLTDEEAVKCFHHHQHSSSASRLGKRGSFHLQLPLLVVTHIPSSNITSPRPAQSTFVLPPRIRSLPSLDLIPFFSVNASQLNLLAPLLSYAPIRILSSSLISRKSNLLHPFFVSTRFHEIDRLIVCLIATSIWSRHFPSSPTPRLDSRHHGRVCPQTQSDMKQILIHI